MLLIEGNSLKEKDRLSRLIERSSTVNISIAEVGYLEALRRAEIGIAMVGKVFPILKKDRELIDFVEKDGRVEILNIERNLLILAGVWVTFDGMLAMSMIKNLLMAMNMLLALYVPGAGHRCYSG